MSDLIGRTLGHYRIVEKIGEGGMGVVYRAHDERLDRDVAIKVLPEAVADDAERLARFEREAKLLASLNHPNIATLHGLEEDGVHRYLVMELVEGESLAAVLARGAIPSDEAMPIALQIATALETAHENGIIHRDLKPANVMVDSEGGVKVLDFGLAKAFDPGASSPQSPESIAESPTLTADMTRAGTLLGTAAYMSPEQARGKTADKRVDIWAFGCVFYEMLSGTRVFSGSTSTEALAAIIKDDPDWDALPVETPAPFHRLLRRCLTKDPRDRLHDIADARIELQSLSTDRDFLDESATSVPIRASWRTWLPWALAVLAALAAVLGWISSARKPSTGAMGALGASAITRFAIYSSGEQRVGVDRDMPLFTISADGSRIAWLGGKDPNRRIFTRTLDETEVRLVPGTEGATNQCILLSPDGREVCFSRGRAIWKVPAVGGALKKVIDSSQASDIWSSDWDSGGTIFIQTAVGLMLIPAGDGAALQLTSVDQNAGEPNHWNPRGLPDGSGLLFTVAAAPPHVDLLLFETGKRETVLERALIAWYLPTGHLLFGRGHTVFAVPFNSKTFETTGSEVPVLSDVELIAGGQGPQLAVADDGTLVYMPRQGTNDRRVAWISLDGEIELTDALPGLYRSISLSPNGSMVAVRTTHTFSRNIELFDLNRGVLERITDDELIAYRSAWSPDGSQLAFSASIEGRRNIYVKSIGVDEPPRLLKGHQESVVEDWSPDGANLLYSAAVPGSPSQNALYLLPVGEGEEDRHLFVGGEARYGRAKFSPDGRWIAYVSNEDGRAEVYLREVVPGQTAGGRKHKVSRNGGWDPIWSPSGQEIYYRSFGGGSILSAAIRTDPVLELGEESLVLEGLQLPTAGWSFGARSFDIAPDGSRFLVVLDTGGPESLQLVVVRNWFEELKRLVPTE